MCTTSSEIEHIYIFEHIYHVKGNMEYLSDQSTKMEHEKYVRTRFGVKLYFCSVLTFSLYFKYVLFTANWSKAYILIPFQPIRKKNTLNHFKVCVVDRDKPVQFAGLSEIPISWATNVGILSQSRG